MLHALTALLIEKETVLGPELDDLIASIRPDFDFFGKKNIYTQPKQSAEPEDQNKSEGNDKDNSETVDSETDDTEGQKPE